MIKYGDKMAEFTSVVSKNGKHIQITLSKVWTIWLIIGSFFGVAWGAISWINGVNSYRDDSTKDRERISAAVYSNQCLLIEFSYNMRNHFEKDVVKPKQDWVPYEKIPNEYKLPLLGPAYKKDTADKR